jgi:GTP-binding protein
LVDTPGYGGRGRPEWGELFDHYVETRKEYLSFPCSPNIFLHSTARLKRILILFNGEHGLNETDRMMIQILDQHCQNSAGLKFTLQAIITKADTIPTDDLSAKIPQIKQDIFKAAPACLPPIITCVAKHSNFGIDKVRKSINDACFM